MESTKQKEYQGPKLNFGEFTTIMDILKKIHGNLKDTSNHGLQRSECFFMFYREGNLEDLESLLKKFTVENLNTLGDKK
jgi:hypothetical protein